MMGRGVISDWQSPEWALARRGCELDDTALMDEAISQSAAGKENQSNFYNHLRSTALRHNAKTILRSLVERGVDIAPHNSYDVANASIETLDLLLIHGWDINSQGASGTPFMWHVVSDDEMVKWCLDHGASVHPRHPQRCAPILEYVAQSGSVQTYSRLLKKGAPPGRSLHLSVAIATVGDPRKEKDKKNQAARMQMVRYLVDKVGLDVNESDQPQEGRQLPGRHGTPICYIPGTVGGMDTRELTWYLLDRGADPTPALKIAEQDYPQFIEDFEAWKVQRKAGESKCCVQ